MPVMTPPAFVNVGTGEEDDAVAMEQKLCWSRHIFRADFRIIPLVWRFSLSLCVSWNVKILAPIVRIAWNASSRPPPLRSKIPLTFWL